MEVQNVPLEPQPDAPSMPSIRTELIGQSAIEPTTNPQPLIPEPRTVQLVQSVSSPAPTPPPQPLQQSQSVPAQQQHQVAQSLYRPSKRLLLLFGLVIIVLYIVGFGGAWVYSRFFKLKQIPTLDQRRFNQVTFSALNPNVYSEEQAIGAIKKAYPDLKDIEKLNDRGIPKTYIRSFQTKTGWKMKFRRGYGECGEKYDGCQREQYYFFMVDFNGLVKEVGQVELEYDPNGDKMESVGTFPPNFFEEDTLNP